MLRVERSLAYKREREKYARKERRRLERARVMRDAVLVTAPVEISEFYASGAGEPQFPPILAAPESEFSKWLRHCAPEKFRPKPPEYLYAYKRTRWEPPKRR